MTGWPVLEIELLWIVSPFNQDLANTCQIHQIHQSLVITNFNWMNASGNQGYIALPFVISRMSLSYGCVLILPLCISSLRFSRHDPILTKHQAFAPSGPMLLCIKSSFVRVEFCCKAWARAWQETLTWETRWSPRQKPYRKAAKSPHINCSSPLQNHSFRQQDQMKQSKSMAHHWYNALPVCRLFCTISD